MNHRTLYAALLPSVLAAFLPLCYQGGSLAYLTARDDRDNVITLCTDQVVIEEEYIPPQDPVPGDVFTKTPVIFNDSLSPCFVRARVEFSDDRAREACELFGFGEGWVSQGDGYFYYEEEMGAGARSTPIFRQVQLSPDLTQEELDALLPFEIYVYAESVASGSLSASEAWAMAEGGGS